MMRIHYGHGRVVVGGGVADVVVKDAAHEADEAVLVAERTANCTASESAGMCLLHRTVIVSSMRVGSMQRTKSPRWGPGQAQTLLLVHAVSLLLLPASAQRDGLYGGSIGLRSRPSVPHGKPVDRVLRIAEAQRGQRSVARDVSRIREHGLQRLAATVIAPAMRRMSLSSFSALVQPGTRTWRAAWRKRRGIVGGRLPEAPTRRRPRSVRVEEAHGAQGPSRGSGPVGPVSG